MADYFLPNNDAYNCPAKGSRRRKLQLHFRLPLSKNVTALQRSRVACSTHMFERKYANAPAPVKHSLAQLCWQWHEDELLMGKAVTCNLGARWWHNTRRRLESISSHAIDEAVYTLFRRRADSLIVFVAAEANNRGPRMWRGCLPWACAA